MTVVLALWDLYKWADEREGWQKWGFCTPRA